MLKIERIYFMIFIYLLASNDSLVNSFLCTRLLHKSDILLPLQNFANNIALMNFFCTMLKYAQVINTCVQ